MRRRALAQLELQDVFDALKRDQDEEVGGDEGEVIEEEGEGREGGGREKKRRRRKILRVPGIEGSRICFSNNRLNLIPRFDSKEFETVVVCPSCVLRVSHLYFHPPPIYPLPATSSSQLILPPPPPPLHSSCPCSSFFSSFLSPLHNFICSTLFFSSLLLSLHLTCFLQKECDLCGNFIHTVDFNAFQSFTNLRFIDFGANRLRFIPSALRSLLHLEELLLNNNCLERIIGEESPSKGGEETREAEAEDKNYKGEDVLSKLQKLRVLDLKSNRISMIENLKHNTALER
jgi:hypothetical protein